MQISIKVDNDITVYGDLCKLSFSLSLSKLLASRVPNEL